MLMRYMAYDAGLDFIDDIVDIDEDFIGGTWESTKKFLPELAGPFKALPVIQHHGVTINETGACSQYVAEIAGYMPNNSLGWSYHQSESKIILIERYENEDANIITAENISPGGQRYELMQEQLDYFTVEKVSVFGAFTDKLIDFNTVTAERVGLKAMFEYNPLISGYSRSSR